MTMTSLIPQSFSGIDRAVMEVCLKNFDGPCEIFIGGTGINVCYEIEEMPDSTDIEELSGRVRQFYSSGGNALWEAFCESGLPDMDSLPDEDEDEAFSTWLNELSDEKAREIIDNA